MSLPERRPASAGRPREFGERGAAVLLAARNETALNNEVAGVIELAGGEAHAVVTDVAEWRQVEHLASEAVSRFGRIDRWVNDASIAEYATVEEMSIEEIDRIIQVDLLGTIYGMKAALPHLKNEDSGTVINISSVLGARAVPLQAANAAAKFGVRGFADSMRMELEREGSNVHITTILPSSINTPFFDHARSKRGAEPKPIPPVYEPSAVAEAILFAAEHPRREIVVGAPGKMMTMMQRISPSFTDRYMLLGVQMFKQQKSDQPNGHQDNLFTPWKGVGSSTGEFGGRMTQSRSLYTHFLGLHPNRGRAALAANGLLGAVALKRRTSN